MSDVSENGSINTQTIKLYKDVKKGYTQFKNDDVLFAKITPCMENGKGAYVKGLKNGLGCGSTEFFVLRPDISALDGEWLYHLTAWPQFRYVAELNMTGSAGQKRVPKSFLNKYQINLLSKEKQIKQVRILNCINRIIVVKQSTLKKLDELIKSRFIEMFGDIEQNSNDYPVYKLGSLCTVSSSKRIYQNEQTSSGVPFLRVSNLVELIDKKELNCDLYIPEEKYSDLLNAGQVPKAEDILVTSRGTLGKCYIVKESDKFYFQDGMISWLSSISINISALFISYLFESQYIKSQIAKLQSGSTVAYLSIDMLKRLNIVVPPIDMQNQFADFVTKVEQQKATVQKSIDHLETLKKSLMQEYFG